MKSLWIELWFIALILIIYTSSDVYAIVYAIGSNQILQRRFKDIRIELRQFVVGQFDDWIIACRNNMKLIK